MKKSYYGTQSGRLTIIDTRELVTRDKALCRCECGVEKYVKINDILQRKTQSCGCLNKELTSKRFLKDLTGQRFEELTVLSFSHVNSNRRAVWWCKCQCGTIFECTGKSLINGNTRSCGCLVSKSEAKCKLVLSNYDIKFESQKSFEGCVCRFKLKFDIYIPSLNTCIELDGEQHFHPVKYFGGEKKFEKGKKRDAIKNKYCLDNDIRLLRIPYTQFDNIEQILIDNKIIKK